MLTSRQGYTKDLEIACRQIHIYKVLYKCVSVCVRMHIYMNVGLIHIHVYNFVVLLVGWSLVNIF